MRDFINNILSAPIANLLIIAGIAFLGISGIGKIVGKIVEGTPLLSLILLHIEHTCYQWIPSLIHILAEKHIPKGLE